ncbi:AraC family transcriptional regulator [Paenibacillus sp. NPDC056579]|uniref:AraC family transcriptional regulator n=1 Tax=Paenibacillus sp. NPDC056579 TaxID=3345871 RepID=UPI0036AB7D3A
MYHFPVSDENPINISFIGTNYCRPDYERIRKRARITVLAYVLSGKGRTAVNNSEAFEAKKGDVFILPEGAYHKVNADPGSEEQWSYIWFNIKGKLALELLHAYKLSDRIVIPNTPVEHLFQKSLNLAQIKNDREMHNELPVLFHQIAITLSTMENHRILSYSADVNKIKNYLDNTVYHSFDSLVMSKQIGLSFKQINRLFKKEVGTTAYHYLLSKKIESAKMMLQETELTISEISYQLGYSDPTYFWALFKKKTGFPPGLFRSKFK